ncbi:MAG: histidine kinase [Carnobacterium sp.]|uniref:cache domain-containing sensor histidine kinase n=1 Tax=Carnobacterium sp. TaxID=48221 RepID=UPI0033160CBA
MKKGIKKIWNFLKKKEMKVTIKQKLLGSYILVLMIPIILVGLFLATEIRQNMINTKIEEIESNNERIETFFLKNLSTVIRIADWIYQDDDLVELVTHQYQDTFEVFQAYGDYEMFDDYIKYYDEIENIRFYVDNPTLTSTNGIFFAEPEIVKKDWYQESLQKKGQISWEEIADPITGKTYFNLTRSIFRDKELIGVLSIAFDNEVLQEILIDSSDPVFITLNNKNLLFNYPQTVNTLEMYQNYHISNVNKEFKSDTENIQQEISGQDFIINSRRLDIPKTNQSTINVIGMVPTKKVVWEANKDIMLSYLVVLAFFALSIILLGLFIRKFNERVIKLNKAISKVANGNLEIPEKIEGNDEITEVYDHLYQTVQSLKQLIEENYQHDIQEKNLEIQQKETQFKVLASQINPHFLYNTLEMIRMKAFNNNDKEVAVIIKILSKLMRKALEGNLKEQPLSEELSFTEMYLQIQKLRFGDRIDYMITQEIQEDYQIIPLIIQPIVENSFIHGIESKEEGGKVEVLVLEKNKELIIHIIDNGIGIEEGKLQKLKLMLETEGEANRIGINNVNQRIKHFYGEDYGLDIESILGEGTKVIICLPIKQLSKDKGVGENV